MNSCAEAVGKNLPCFDTKVAGYQEHLSFTDNITTITGETFVYLGRWSGGQLVPQIKK
jgi:hypothetical protein